LVTIQSLDAALQIISRLAHILTIHVTWKAMTTAAPHGEDGQVPRRDPLDLFTNLHHPSQQFMANDEFVTSGRCLRPASRNFLSVSAADAHLKNLKLDLMRIVDMRFIPLGHVDGTFARING
jgi:hypothetical protein